MILQACIVLLSLTTIYCLSSRSPRVRWWGCLVGLCGQPFWAVAMIQTRQWGVLLLTACYALSYVRGLRNNRRGE